MEYVYVKYATVILSDFSHLKDRPSRGFKISDKSKAIALGAQDVSRAIEEKDS